MTRQIDTDYLVAGGGIAGVLLAEKLAASGKRIVVIEQGPRYTGEDRAAGLERRKETLNVFADYNDTADRAVVTPHSSAPEGEGVTEWTAQRVFGLGGTALHFEGLMIRPQEDDLRVRTRFGYSRDWPLSYAELEPWLLLAEQEIGVSGSDDNPYSSFRSGPFPMPAHPYSYFDREIFGPALEKLGIVGHSCPRGTNSTPYGGRSSCLACRVCRFCPSGARYSPDRAHVPRLDRMKNVEILDRVSLRRLDTGADGSRIETAHAIHVPDEKPLVMRAGRYVLAMGGVETTRMLLLSADERKHREGLGNMEGQLGRWFSDHFHPYVTIDAGRHVGVRLGFETMVSEHFRTQIDRAVRAGFLLLGAPAMDWFPVGDEATTWSLHDSRLSLEEVRERLPRMATISGMTELEGKGVIELDEKERDSFGAPVARITMNLSDWDRSSLNLFGEVTSKLADAMNAAGMSDVSSYLDMGYHPSGATAMAQSPEDGVCDPNLKVFGLDNLYLVSNSVFPHMGANPPTLTIAALALRLAAHLEGRA